MMKDLNNRINCKELNRCLDETDEIEPIEKDCIDAIACYNFVIYKNNKTCLKKGCFEHPNELQFYCNKNKINVNKNNLRNGYEGFCCNDLDYCNGILEQVKPPKSHLNAYLTIFGLIFAFVSISLICFLVLFKRKKSKRKKKRNTNKDTQEDVDSSALKNITSGSGAGFPLLIERTLTKEIQLETQIGKGKFGEVWRGKYLNRQVAVKIFHTTDYDSWKKETEIYNQYSLASEFILKYLGSDITSSESCTTEFWIVLDYHELGSLYDYLQRNTLKKDQMISIMYSAISGLVHLHDLFEFTTSKPAIAHRDLKSKNLIMKSDSIVCIADFGLSVTSKGIETNKYEYLNIRSGTKRYMPPELLSEMIDVKSFKAFQQADVYSFSLLLWEIIVHSELNPHSTNYKPPYFEYIGDDPSFDEMKKIVLIEQKRPSLNFLKNEPESGNASTKLTEVKIEDNEIGSVANSNQKLIDNICDLIENCWKTNASKRYDYIEIRKKFTQIINSNRSNR